MVQNISDRERVLRVVLGIYSMLLGFMFIQGVVGIVIGVIGVIAFLTGATGFCGLYVLLGKEPVERVSEDDVDADADVAGEAVGKVEAESSAEEDEEVVHAD